MSPSSGGEVTRLLRAWSDGDASALQKLTPLVYDELHRAAQRHLARQRPDHTLQASALVNEVYLRLVNYHPPSWQDRAHFFALSAQVMRRILVDWARSRHAAKRGLGAVALELDEALVVSEVRGGDLLALDDSLKSLAALDPRKGRVVELRFFGGLSVEETAEVLKVSKETVMRDWRLAKSWLRRELRSEGQSEA
jgi:RNA polymerase sigma factor (TIGR02999 family)